MKRILWIKVRGGARLLREIGPTIRRGAAARLRWESLKDRGIVSVGRNTYGFPNVYSWDALTSLKIGNYCSIAEGVTFILGGEHRMDWITTYPFNVMADEWPLAAAIIGHPATKGDIIIGNDVWIGHGALILSGVSIGNGAVIGAGAVVTKSIEDYAVVAGNPATFVKYRFDEPTRNRLLEMAWWNWSDSEVSHKVQLLMRPPEIFD